MNSLRHSTTTARTISRAHRAFTFTELMVVIAITAILGALLLPALCKAKAHARTAACASNLRQIGLALTIYVGDFRKYPTGMRWVVTSLPWYANQVLTPYTARSRREFFCPAQRPATKPGIDFCPLSYGYNSLGSARQPGSHLGLGDGSHRLISEAEIKMPSDMISVGDSGSETVWDMLLNPNTQQTAAWSAECLTTLNSWLPSRRHAGGANIVMCDGHVEHAKQDWWIDKNDSVSRAASSSRITGGLEMDQAFCG
jgi:prepilin-type processing-associated H-X9-DG protein/prepilin-type N-terminal cleavage/methylation domain-containing protein